LLSDCAQIIREGLLNTLSAEQPRYPPPRAGSNFETWIEAGRTSSDSRARFIALQPIFNRLGSVFGYEALCRTARSNRFSGDSRDATHSITRDWLLDGLDKLTGGKPVFLNCTREDLGGGFLTLLPVSIVVEVLETVQVDEEVVDACRRIKASGHYIALDDSQLYGNNDSLIELADYIKVDFQLHGKEQWKEVGRSVSSKPMHFIAEKIETRQELEAALDEGFHLLQGYYLSPPILLSKGRALSSWSNHFRLRWPFRLRCNKWR